MRIVVVGSSFAGMTVAEELRKRLGKRADILVLDRSDRFVFRPSLPWLVFGDRDPEDISVPLRPLLRAKGVRFTQASVESIEPERNTVRTDAGEHRYDYLVLAAGATSPIPAPAHLAEHGFAPLWIREALQLRRALHRFTGGAAVVAMHPRSPLACAAYEYVFQLAAFLRRRGVARKSRVTFVTYEERPFAIGGSTAVRAMERRLGEEGIRLMPRTFIDAATDRTVTLANNHVLRSDLLMYIPPFRGAEWLQRVPGLTDKENFIIVDANMRTHAYGNVFAAGDGVALPGPKSALMAELQARTVATNIAADYGLAEHTAYNSAMGCMLDLGPGRGLLSIRKPAPQQGPTKTYFVLPGALNRLGKLAFEQYFLRSRLRV